jgi:hypothetical protein
VPCLLEGCAEPDGLSCRECRGTVFFGEGGAGRGGRGGRRFDFEAALFSRQPLTKVQLSCEVVGSAKRMPSAGLCERAAGRQDDSALQCPYRRCKHRHRHSAPQTQTQYLTALYSVDTGDTDADTALFDTCDADMTRIKSVVFLYMRRSPC